MKLDTAEKILEALGVKRTVGYELQLPGNTKYTDRDTATAERLALAMRVLEIVEHYATNYPGSEVTCQEILAEAAQKEGK